MVVIRRMNFVRVMGFTFLLTLGLCVEARAQPARNLTIGPTEIKFTGRPGQRGTSAITVNNQTSKTVNIVSKILDVGQAPTIKLAPAGTTPYSCAAWTTLTPKTLTVGAGQKKLVSVSIRAPAGSSGSYHGAIQLLIQPPGGRPRTSAGAQIGPVVLTSVFIARTQRPKLGVVSVKVDLRPPFARRELARNLQPTATVLLKNSGNCLTEITGQITIRNAKTHSRTASGSVLGTNYRRPPTILPKISVPLFIPLSRKVPDGQYVADIRLNYGTDKRLRARVPFVVGSKTTTRPANVAELLAVEVEPDLLIVRLPPGARRSQVIEVRNDSEKTVRLSATLHPLGMTTDGSPQIGTVGDEKLDITKYVALRRVPKAIRAGRKDRIMFVVTLPRGQKRAPPCLLLNVLAGPEGDKKAQDTAYPCQILLAPRDAEPAGVVLEGIEYVSSPEQKGRDAVVVSLANISGSYGQVRGEIQIREQAGRLCGKQTFGQRIPMLILPGAKREVDVHLDEGIKLEKDKTYLVVHRLGVYDERPSRKPKMPPVMKEQYIRFTLRAGPGKTLMVKEIERIKQATMETGTDRRNKGNS